jgi:spermidine synthase
MNTSTISQNKVATFLLALSMFFTGASGLVNEYVLSSVSTYIMGSSIEQFSITIALMLGMMGIGSSVQRFVNDENLIVKFVYIEISLALIGSFAPIIVYASFGYLENHFNLIYYFLVMSIGFLIGFEIPFIIRINEKYSNELKTNLSTVMAADYIGSFVGALIWVYYLLPSFNLNQISFLVSGMNFIVALIAIIYFIKIKLIKMNIVSTIMIFIISIILILGYFNVTKWELSLEQKLYADPIIATQTTKYQHLTLTQNKILDEYRFYINGNVQFSSLDEARYHEMLVHPLMALTKNPKNILILGGGDGLAIRELKKYEGIESITLVDLDPEMLEFAKTNSIMKKINKNAFDDAKITILKNSVDTKELKDIYKRNEQNTNQKIASVSVFNIDADIFLRKLKDKTFDVIIIDFPDPSSIELNKLYTKQFYLKLKNLMNENTKVIVQATSPYHAKEAFLCIGRTLNAAGLKTVPLHMNIPSFGEWGWYIASKSKDINLAEEISQLESMSNNTSFLTLELFKNSLHFGKNELISEHKSINTLMSPVLLNIYNTNSWLYY